MFSARCLPALLLLAIALVLSACQESSSYKKVSLAAGGGQVEPVGTVTEGKLPLRVAIAGVISPKESIRTYRELLDHLGRELGRPVEIVQRRTYAEINDLVRGASVDVAFVCGGAYVEGNNEFGMELLAVPEVRGEITYHSYVIVPRESTARELSDLQGKTFAFSDPMSNSGRLAPTYALLQRGEAPESFFGKYVFTYSHDNSIKSVAEKLVDGAAVDSLVYDFTIARNPQFSGRTRVIWKSPAFGSPPIVVHPGLNPQLKSALKEFFLRLHESPSGRAILGELLVDRFVQADDRLYDPIRQMLIAVRQSREGR